MHGYNDYDLNLKIITLIEKVGITIKLEFKKTSKLLIKLNI
jgi:hypothetical protein